MAGAAESTRRHVLAVIGPGQEASPRDVADAFEVAALAARAGWVVVTGGRDVGVMDAASRGARSAEGIAIGILPDTDARGASRAVDVAIVTGIGEMRDQIVVLSSDAIVVCGMSPGTAAEVALGIKAQKPVVLLRPDPAVQRFFDDLSRGTVRVAGTPEESMAIAGELVRQRASSKVQDPRSK